METTDREKIISAFEDYEPYAHDLPAVTMKSRVYLDALELLKEQKAQEQCLKTKCIICPHCDNCDVDENGLLKEQKAVKIEVKKINDSGRCGRCPNCLMELNEMDYPNWCGYCGQKVKWNG